MSVATMYMSIIENVFICIVNPVMEVACKAGSKVYTIKRQFSA